LINGKQLILSIGDFDMGGMMNRILWDELVKRAPYAQKLIGKNIIFPTKEEQLAAVKVFGEHIQHIINPDRDVQLEAIKQNCYAIQYIGDPDKEVVIRYMLDVCPSEAISFVGDLLRLLRLFRKRRPPVDSWDHEYDFIREWINKKPRIIKDAPYAFLLIKNNIFFPTKEEQLAAVNRHGQDIQWIYHPDKDVQSEAIRQDINSIKYIHNPDKEVVVHYLLGVCPDLLRNPEYDLEWDDE
jgi:hypothetical protein